jgi:hypothetical protein
MILNLMAFTSFAICWLADRVRQMKNVQTGTSETIKAKVVVVEVFHADGTSERGWREIISMLGKPTLAALEMVGDASDSAYAKCLQPALALAAE